MDNPIVHLVGQYFIVVENAVLNYYDVHITYLPATDEAFESEEDIAHNKEIIETSEQRFLQKFCYPVRYYKDIRPYGEISTQ